MSKICNFCGNKNFKQKSVQHIYQHEGKLLIVNNVPCEECAYCGEKYFTAKVLKKIEQEFKEIYFSGKRAARRLTVPVEEFMEI
jgi:YgiT-type zinc finger domain-containing protein